MARTALGIVNLAQGGSDLALAERLFDNLRNLILDGVWRYGDKLPGTRTIARDAGVSRWTAVVAIDMLLAEGLVEARKRSGTYVAWRGEARTEVAPRAPSSTRGAAPFTLSVPALDLFPMAVWRRLQARRWRDMPASALEDSHPAGWPALRQAIADFAATSRGLHCSADQVIVVPSVEAAGRLVAKVMCRPGSTAWIENPGTKNARDISISGQLVPISINVDNEGIRVDEGARLAPDASLAVVTPAAQFPRGTRMSDMRRAQLLQWARTSGSWIFEIDHMAEFPFGPPPLAAQDSDRVVYFDTFGKLMFPSLRIAYLIVPRAFAPAFQEAVLSCDRPPGMPTQIVLSDFLVSGQFAKHLRACRDAYTERRRTIIRALSDHCADTLTIEPGQAGLFLCARLPSGIDDVQVVDELRSAGVAAMPLSEHFERPAAESGLILGFSGFTPEQLREAALKLSSVLKAKRRERRFAVG